MFARILILAVATHAAFADPSYSHTAPVLDALAAHHNIAVSDQSYTDGLKQALGANVAIHNEPIHFKTGYVGTLNQPVGTGQIINEHVETIALGQQAQARANIAHVVAHPAKVQTQVVQQSVQVPVQTMQTVQVPSVSYQTVQVPVHIQKEIVEVEKPVPVPHPVAVESPPKPYVKEAVYARPFQRSQKYVRTRITPVEEVTERAYDTTTTQRITTTTQAEIIHGHQVDLTEENLYYANKKRKIVTRFIKIEEMYEAESWEEIGVFYDFGPTSDDDFELKVTRIFEVDAPVLVKNETVTTKVSYLRSPSHIIHEYMNGHLEHSYYAGNPNMVFNGVNASSDHFQRFHSYGGSSFSSITSPTFKSPDFHKYTQIINGREVEIEERTTVLPGGRALFIEKRIRAIGDISPFADNIEAIPSFETQIQNGKELLVFTLTYDSTRRLTHTKYGIAASEGFGNEFSSFLNEFKKVIPSKGAVFDRLKRDISRVENQMSGSRKKRSVEIKKEEKVEEKKVEMKVEEKKIEKVTDRKKRTPDDDIEFHNNVKKRTPDDEIEFHNKVKKSTPQNQIEYHNKIYKFKGALPLRDYNPGGFIYRSDDGQEIKVEEETITNIDGAPKNEYLRYSQVYVPRKKVKYEVSGLYGQPIDSWSGLGSFYGNYQGYPHYNNYFDQGSSYKINNPFFNY